MICTNPSYRISGSYAVPDNCTSLPIQSDNVVYSGPNLSGSGVTNCNTLTVALQKLDNKLNEVIQELYNMTSSTTTTTTTV